MVPSAARKALALFELDHSLQHQSLDSGLALEPSKSAPAQRQAPAVPKLTLPGSGVLAAAMSDSIKQTEEGSSDCRPGSEAESVGITLEGLVRACGEVLPPPTPRTLAAFVPNPSRFPGSFRLVMIMVLEGVQEERMDNE